MKEKLIPLITRLTVTQEQYDLLLRCSMDLDIPFAEVVRAVVTTAVSKHFDSLNLEEDFSDD